MTKKRKIKRSSENALHHTSLIYEEQYNNINDILWKHWITINHCSLSLLFGVAINIDDEKISLIFCKYPSQRIIIRNYKYKE